jgi:hypothetical protein
MKKRPANKKTKVKGYNQGGKVATTQGPGRGIMKTNQMTGTSKGGGASVKGNSFKY